MAGNVLGAAECQGYEGNGGVGAAAGRQRGRADYVQVGMIVSLAVAVAHAFFRIGSHACASSRVVLVVADGDRKYLRVIGAGDLVLDVLNVLMRRRLAGFGGFV
jgi:hypothetical protein